MSKRELQNILADIISEADNALEREASDRQMILERTLERLDALAVRLIYEEVTA